MRMIKGLLAATAATLAFAGTSAHADTLWNFTYSGDGVSASGSFVTVGNGSTPTVVESMTGTYTDAQTTGAISLIPAGAPGATVTSADGLYYYDDLFGGSSSIDNSGLLFFAGSQDVNLYTDGGMISVTHYGSGYVFSNVTFSAVAVPEPGSLGMLLAGIAALGFVSRRKARR
jgi:PEP-CTERM motif